MSSDLGDPIEPLITADEVARRVRELGAAIAQEYADRPLTLVGVLRGATLFLADLARAIDLPLVIDFVTMASYGQGTESSGAVRVVQPAMTDLRGRDVLIVEDIVDTGLTLVALIEYLRGFQPRTVRVCTFLSKPARRRVAASLDFVGFEIPDRFVVGYGLDYAERYRNLPYIGYFLPPGSEAQDR